MNITNALTRVVPDSIGAANLGGGVYRLDFDGFSRAATDAEILEAHKLLKIDVINTDCKTRLIARYGQAEEQVSRSLGIYGVEERSAMESGIAATIDASNAASNVVIGSTSIAQVEAVTVAWPVI